jgi:DNA-nicking Smr family endonuclease
VRCRYQALPTLDLHGLSAATAQLALVDMLRRTFAFVCTARPKELGDLKVGSSR